MSIPSKPQWKEGLSEVDVEINCDGQKLQAQGITHENTPGLAVTMHPFGLFTVTHINTGLRMCNTYERSASALLAMSQFSLIAKMQGKSWVDLDKDGGFDLMQEAAESEVPFDGNSHTSIEGTRKMTVKEWFQVIRMPMWDEFPWEDRDPFDEALENFKKLGGAA